MVRAICYPLLGLIIMTATPWGCANRTKELQALQEVHTSLDSAVGQATRGDVLQQWGPPTERTVLEGDEFWVYRKPYVDQLSRFGRALQGMGAGLQGKTVPPSFYHQPTRVLVIILRFDGSTGILKGWSLRK